MLTPVVLTPVVLTPVVLTAAATLYRLTIYREAKYRGSMSIFVADPALSRRDNVRRMVLTVAFIAAFLGGVLLFALVIAPNVGAAGGCGGG